MAIRHQVSEASRIAAPMLTRSSPLGQMTSDVEVIITISYQNSTAHIRILRDPWNDPITIQATEKPNLSLSPPEFYDRTSSYLSVCRTY